MKILLTGAVALAIAGQLTAETYPSGAVVVLPLAAAVPVFSNPNVSRWGYPARDYPAARYEDNRFHDAGYTTDPLYDDYPAQAGIVVVVAMPQGQASPAPAQTPAPAIHSQMREYHWPSSGENAGATDVPIVAKDGPAQSATAPTRRSNAEKQVSSPSRNTPPSRRADSDSPSCTLLRPARSRG